jgi:hypothetical protein
MNTETNQLGKSIIIANNDIVYLWWTYPQKIKDCLGFSIHRIVDGHEEKKDFLLLWALVLKTINENHPKRLMNGQSSLLTGKMCTLLTIKIWPIV